MHPLYEFRQAMHFAEPEAIIPSVVTNHLGKQGKPVNLYSDGSCQHQNCPTTRFSAYSLVADLCESDSDRIFQANKFKQSGKMPETLRVVAKARCKAEQHIGRAELFPIVLAHEAFHEFKLYSDSAYAVNTVALTRCVNSAEALEYHNEYDLAARIFQVKHENKQVVKIKAHQDPGSVEDPLECYHCLGNKLADEAAGNMCLFGNAAITNEFQQFHCEVSQQCKFLERVYTLLLKLQKARAQAGGALTDGSLKTNAAAVNTLEQSIITWIPPGETWKPPEILDITWLKFSSWGWQVATIVQTWLQGCRWPTDNSGPKGFTMGISWAELVFAISDMLGAWIPVRRHDNEGQEILLQPLTHAEALVHSVSLSELCYNMQQIFWQVVALIPQQVVPSHLQSGKNNSLLLQGHSVWTTGLKLRPAFCNQQRVYDMTQKFVKKGTSNSLIDHEFEGNFSSWTFDLESCKKWEERCKVVRSKVKLVSKQRKSIQSE